MACIYTFKGRQYNEEEFRALMGSGFYVATVESAKQDLADIFGESFSENETEFTIGLINGNAFGQFRTDGSILLSSDQISGTQYHEAFHRVWRMYATEAQKQSVLNEIKKRSDYSDRSKELLRRGYTAQEVDEELLAEDFRYYSVYKVKLENKNTNNIFETLLNFIKKIVKSIVGKEKELFDSILSGKYKNMKIINKNNKNANMLINGKNVSTKVYQAIKDSLLHFAITKGDLLRDGTNVFRSYETALKHTLLAIINSELSKNPDIGKLTFSFDALISKELLPFLKQLLQLFENKLLLRTLISKYEKDNTKDELVAFDEKFFKYLFEQAETSPALFGTLTEDVNRLKTIFDNLSNANLKKLNNSLQLKNMFNLYKLSKFTKNEPAKEALNVLISDFLNIKLYNSVTGILDSFQNQTVEQEVKDELDELALWKVKTFKELKSDTSSYRMIEKIIESTGIILSDELDVIEDEDGKHEHIRDVAYNKVVFEFDRQESMSPLVKLLVKSIDKGSVDNVLGTPVLFPSNVILGKLMSRLANTPAEYINIVFEKLILEDSNLKSLYDIYKNLDVYRKIMFLNSFTNHLYEYQELSKDVNNNFVSRNINMNNATNKFLNELFVTTVFTYENSNNIEKENIKNILASFLNGSSSRIDDFINLVFKNNPFKLTTKVATDRFKELLLKQGSRERTDFIDTIVNAYDDYKRDYPNIDPLKVKVDKITASSINVESALQLIFKYQSKSLGLARWERIFQKFARTEGAVPLSVKSGEGTMYYAINLPSSFSQTVDKLNFIKHNTNIDDIFNYHFVKNNVVSFDRINKARRIYNMFLPSSPIINEINEINTLDEHIKRALTLVDAVPHLFNASNTNSVYLRQYLSSNTGTVLELLIADNVQNGDKSKSQGDLLIPELYIQFLYQQNFNEHRVLQHADRTTTYIMKHFDFGFVNDGKINDVYYDKLSKKILDIYNTEIDSNMKTMSSIKDRKQMILEMFNEDVANNLNGDLKNAVKRFILSEIDIATKEIKNTTGLSTLSAGIVEKAISNSYLNHLEEITLFTGDLSLYSKASDILKRTSGLSGTGTPSLVTNDVTNKLVDFIGNFKDSNGTPINYLSNRIAGKELTEVVAKEELFEASNDVNDFADLLDDFYFLSFLPKDRLEQKKNAVRSAYGSINENDGQSYINIYAYYQYSIMMGEANPKLETTVEFEHFVFLHADNDNYQSLHDYVKAFIELKALNVTLDAFIEDRIEKFTVKKPQYFGPVSTTSGTTQNAIMGIRKTSYMPLVPSLLLFNNGKKDKRALWSVMSNSMNNKIDIIHMESAAKFGTKKPKTLFDIDLYNEKEITFLKSEYMKNQQKIENSQKDEIVNATQKRKMMFSNLMYEGVPIDFLTKRMKGFIESVGRLPTKEELDEAIKVSKQEWLDTEEGTEKDEMSDLYRLSKEIVLASKELYEISISELEKDLSFIQTDTSGLIFSNLTKLVNKLKNSVMSRPIAMNIEESLDLLLNDAVLADMYNDSIKEEAEKIYKQINIEELPMRNQIEPMLMSLITNGVIREKRPGASAPQVAPTGFESLSSFKKDRLKVSSALKFYSVKKDENKISLNGITNYAEIIIPLPNHLKEPIKALYLKHLVDNNKDTTNVSLIQAVEWFNNEISTEKGKIKYADAITVFGLRIPNQQTSSNDVLIVKEFYYGTIDNFVVVPAELVTKVGADFDIDKLNMYFKNLTVKGVLKNKEVLPKALYEAYSLKDTYLQKINNNTFEIINTNAKVYKQSVKKLTVSRKENSIEIYIKFKNGSKTIVLNTEKGSEKLSNQYRNTLKLLREQKEIKSTEYAILVEYNDFIRNLNRWNLLTSQYDENYLTASITNSYDEFKRVLGKEGLDRINNLDNEVSLETKDSSDKLFLQNHIFQLEAELLTHSANRANLLMTIDTSTSNEIFANKDIVPEYLNTKQTLNGVINPLANLRNAVYFVHGKYGVGIVALYTSAKTLGQYHNIQLLKNKTVYDGTLSETMKSVDPILFEIEEEGNNISLGRMFDTAGNNIPAMLSEIMTMQVDNVKDPKAIKMGITLRTLPITCYLLSRGMSLDNIVKFLLNTGVQHYIKLSTQNENIFNPIQASNDAIIAKAKEDKRNDANYIDLFVALTEEAKEYGKFVNALGSDTRRAKNMVEAVSLKDNVDYHKDNKSTIVAANEFNKILEDSIVGPFYKGQELYKTLFENLYFTNIGTIRYLNNFIDSVFFFKKQKDKDSLKQEAFNDLLSFLYFNYVNNKEDFLKALKLVENSGLNKENKAFKIINHLQKTQNENLDNQYLLSTLFFDTSKKFEIQKNKQSLNSTPLALLRLFNTASTTDEINLTISAVEQLDNEQKEELVMLSLLSAGFNNSPFNLSKILPANLMKPILKQIANVLENIQNSKNDGAEVVDETIASETDNKIKINNPLVKEEINDETIALLEGFIKVFMLKHMTSGTSKKKYESVAKSNKSVEEIEKIEYATNVARLIQEKELLEETGDRYKKLFYLKSTGTINQIFDKYNTPYRVFPLKIADVTKLLNTTINIDLPNIKNKC